MRNIHKKTVKKSLNNTANTKEDGWTKLKKMKQIVIAIFENLLTSLMLDDVG